MVNRRQFLGGAAGIAAAAAAPKPNVVFVLTDDQGWGDVAIHGNRRIRTPNMDRLAREGVQFTQFHVNPVCSPTRACLLTGRYNYRTGIVDTFLGRSMMHGDETTLAEMLAGAGYRTGIFGKWHLGDNYPMRAMDQGFQEAVVLRGGGLRQAGDPPGSDGYSDPILLRNGKPERFRGYCTDIYTGEALKFIEKNRRNPFFLYLPTNAPHVPLEVPERYEAPYRDMGLDEVTAKVYGMVTNVDDNIGRVLAKLEELDLVRDTIVVFMTDNGPQQSRYNGGMRGRKSTVYEGGIRVPCFVRWPRVVKAGTTIDRLAAHIDFTPTLLEACGARAPERVKLDGRSLMPLIRGDRRAWPDRTVFFQSHRGDEPELYRNCAARTQRWKLVNGRELYDMAKDPAEANDVAARHPEIVARLRRQYEAWFRDVSATRGYAPSRIHIGARQENPVILTRQDWRGPRAGWNPDSLGHWEVLVTGAARYEVSVLMAPAAADGEVRFSLNGAELRQAVDEGDTACRLGAVEIPAGPGRLEAEVAAGGRPVGVHFVELKRI